MNVSPNPTPINPSEITLGESLMHVSWVKVSYAIWQGKSVVVKQLRLTEKGDPTLEDCRREATLLHDSRHSNIVGLYGVCNKTTEYWLVLERVAKGALEQVLSREELPWETRLRIANDMTSGLNYLHGKGLLHRDIKSSNVLIDEKNQAKLADFGIAKPEEETSTKTHTQGTWKWCAPEVIENRKFSKHSDTYALGMVFWELSSRETPFKQMLIARVPQAISEGKRPEMPKSTPASFAMLIRACWSHHAEARPLCPEILECLRPMIQPKDPPPNISPSSFSNASVSASVSALSASSSAPSLADSPSQAPRTVTDLTRLLKPLTSNPQVKADKELKALFSDKLAELLIQEETNPLKEIDQPFYRTAQHLLDEDGQINDMFKQALLKIGAPKVSLPQTASPSSSKPAAPTLPSLAFGATAWNDYFGDVGTEPPLPPNIHEILNASCPYWPDKKVSETHMLVLIPEKVNGRPLTLNTLGELVKTPKKGNASNYHKNSFFHAYGDISAHASHWILMTRDVIPGSRKQTFTAQKALLKGGDTVPKLLDATAAIFMQDATGGKHGYGRDPWTYTRCEEPYNQRQMLVGGLALVLALDGGLRVSSPDGDHDYVGVAGARKF